MSHYIYFLKKTKHNEECNEKKCVLIIVLNFLPLFIQFAGCSEGAVRLVGGADNTEGRVEICFSDTWGTVCNQMWNITDASIVCLQLQLNYTGRQ